MGSGDGAREAYTATVWGVLLSHERYNIAEAEALDMVEGNMCGTVNARRRRSAGVGDHITRKDGVGTWEASWPSATAVGGFRIVSGSPSGRKPTMHGL